MPRVRVEAALLHHRLNQGLLLHRVEIEFLDDFIKQIVFRARKLRRKTQNAVAVIAHGDFLG